MRAARLVPVFLVVLFVAMLLGVFGDPLAVEDPE